MCISRFRFLVVTIIAATTVATAAEDDLTIERALLDKARSEVDALVNEMLVVDADLKITLPYAPLIDAIQQLNTLPKAQRRVTLQSFQRNGYLWEDGPTWCNSYAEIQGPNDLTATADLSSFSAKADADGKIMLRARADIAMGAQIHWHFMGRRITAHFMGAPVGGGICPPGGGFGGSIGARGNTGIDMTSAITFAVSPDGKTLTYNVDLISPRRVGTTLSFGFQHIGELGIPMNFSLPVGRVASGEVPLLFGKDGEVILPNRTIKKYRVELKPVSIHADQHGLSAAWTSTIIFQ